MAEVTQVQPVYYSAIPLDAIGVITHIEFITQLIVAIGISPVILWLLSKKFKFEKQSYKYAIILGIIIFLIASFLNYIIHVIIQIIPPAIFTVSLLILDYLIRVILIKYIYSEKWGKSSLVGLIWDALHIIISIIVFLIILAFIYIVRYIL